MKQLDIGMHPKEKVEEGLMIRFATEDADGAEFMRTTLYPNQRYYDLPPGEEREILEVFVKVEHTVIGEDAQPKEHPKPKRTSKSLQS